MTASNPKDLLQQQIDDAVKKFATTPTVKSYLPDRLTRAAIAERIDHTQLAVTATPENINAVCEEARAKGFIAVCVTSLQLPLAAKLLQGSETRPICTIGFPAGTVSTAVKAYETRWSVQHGAREIDMVISIGHLKAKDYTHVYNDIKAVQQVCPADVPLKVILETGVLERNEIIAGCILSKQAGASFVKTSTGFGAGQATVANISLMRAVVGEGMGVKASGGIRDWEAAKAMLVAGADRLGASAGVKILDEMPQA
ncbi:MAG: hypothetical protein M1833_003577 [Piccolia ochrophora]|nr:MAG: hypothetical protein M1833_003577 [Piccolia ochrophora]